MVQPQKPNYDGRGENSLFVHHSSPRTFNEAAVPRRRPFLWDINVIQLVVINFGAGITGAHVADGGDSALIS